LKLSKKPESSVETSVHWKIVQDLLLCGADIETAGGTGESCLEIAEHCSILKDLLLAPVDFKTMPSVIENWKPESAKHNEQLSMVARKVKCQQVETLHFCKPSDTNAGFFGYVFPGIDAQDGREVAVKCIDKSEMPNESGSESVLVPTLKCEQIVQYLFCKEDKSFYYIAFELMEGNLEDYLNTTRNTTCDTINTTKLCKDVLLGLKFLHDQDIVHGSINPRNVFYQDKPSLCLKIGNCVTKPVDRRRGWVAAEVLKSTTTPPKSSDMFSCGLVIHYLLSAKNHPFAPVHSTTKTPEESLHDTDMNVLNNNIVKLDDSLSPEATHLVQLMLDGNVSNRPTATEALVHPFFWSNKTKKDFLNVLGNEPEVAQKILHPFTMELETRFNTIVTKERKWNGSPSYKKIAATYTTMKIKKKYDYGSVASLIRFIRNAYQHINEQPANIQSQWEKDFVFSDCFPHLVIEVYKALTTSKRHNLHQSRKAIQTFLSNL
jgi:serine/threonine protein kinase